MPMALCSLSGATTTTWAIFLNSLTCRTRDVQPTELAHALECLANQHGFKVKGTRTPAFYRSFVNSIKGYGRVHEFGMMLRFYLSTTFYLLTHPIATLKMLPLSLKLFLRKRMPLLPKRIKGREELSKIIQRFREVRGS